MITFLDIGPIFVENGKVKSLEDCSELRVVRADLTPGEVIIIEAREAHVLDACWGPNGQTLLQIELE